MGGRVVGAYELYHDLAIVEPLVADMQRSLWISLAVALSVLYLVLYGLVRRASSQLRAAADAEQRALRGSEERLRSLIGNTADVITIIEADGRLRYQSPAAERSWGYGAGALDGAILIELVCPEDHPAARQLVEQARTADGTIATELRIRHADNSERDFEVFVVNRLDDPGVAGIVATFHDITERTAFERDCSGLPFTMA